MANRRLPWIILAIGLVFLGSPLYWNLLTDTGLRLLLDWFSYLGIGNGYLFYVPLGGMYVLAGAITLYSSHETQLDFRQLAIGVGVSLLGIWVGLLSYHWVFAERVLGDWGLVFVLASAPVMVGFLVGASADPSTTRNLWVFAALLLLPFLGRNAVIVMDAWPGTFTAIVYIIFTALVVVLDTIWAYPLYRLGRSIR